eukprot:CAMPEP_0204915258 /NCGR_PEP_ID=MMETSP1397-20131031/13291_1 /ASSEMBLY_ACC=CAM_ASM_000891 /TAXON_ID=49980 /ORGANISM="Climacostomum Climacostomum virens, Strain Stock W-24" /LENGTH=135 /DNA_ID=CAMNT_0052087217 /DNA_START=662 /DNA_END=1066 /DNA_ORIENTATION=+
MQAIVIRRVNGREYVVIEVKSSKKGEGPGGFHKWERVSVKESCDDNGLAADSVRVDIAATEGNYLIEVSTKSGGLLLEALFTLMKDDKEHLVAQTRIGRRSLRKYKGATTRLQQVSHEILEGFLNSAKDRLLLKS